MTNDLTDLERQLLLFVVAKAPVEHQRAILEQIQAATVSSRTPSDWGFYTDFNIPPAVPVIPLDLTLADDLPHPNWDGNIISAVLYIQKGRLHFLEASSSTEWPPPYEMNFDFERRCRIA